MTKFRKRPQQSGHTDQRSGGFRIRQPDQGRPAEAPIDIYGLHAAAAALANPRRQILAASATPNAALKLRSALEARGLTPEIVQPRDLDRRLGEDAVHQGVVLRVAPLAPVSLDDLADAKLLVVLDQVTDPHNVGAVLRSAAAFGAAGLVMTARHSPSLSGVVAKAASGALDLVDIATVPNLARAMEQLGEMGFHRVGFDSDAKSPPEPELARHKLALVFGAEDRGLRRLTVENCDALCALETGGALRSLNLSNAAAIALYLAHQAMRKRDAGEVSGA
jgi:23S rRNA (guanosine2251-2'-O)-methyltransferase